MALDIGSLLGSLFGEGSMKGIGDFLGGDIFKNLMSGGTALYGANQMGDMMDFQKDMAVNADNRTQTLFENDQEDREFNKNLDFS